MVPVWRFGGVESLHGARHRQRFLELANFPRGHDLAVGLHQRTGDFGRKQLRVVLAEDLLRGPADDLRGGRVRHQVAPPGVLEVDGVASTFDDRTEQRVALAQLLLGPLAVGDLVADCHVLVGFAPLVQGTARSSCPPSRSSRPSPGS